MVVGYQGFYIVSGALEMAEAQKRYCICR